MIQLNPNDLQYYKECISITVYGIFNLWFLVTDAVMEDEDDDEAVYQDADEPTPKLAQNVAQNVPTKVTHEMDARIQQIGLSSARVSRTDMLKICGSFNQLKKVAQDQKVPSKSNPMNILLSSGPGSKAKESMISSALKSVHRIVDPNEVMDVSLNLIMKPDKKADDKEKTSEQSKKRKPSKASSFSKIIDESFIELDSPTKETTDTVPPGKMYTEAEVQDMLNNLKAQENRKFQTSTPTKNDESPVIATKNIRRKNEEEPTRFSPRIEARKAMEANVNTSILDKVKKLGENSNRKNLFHGNDAPKEGDVIDVSQDESLKTIPTCSPMAKPLNDSIKAQIWEADINAHTRKIMEDSAKIIVEEHQKISLDLLKTQAQLVENTSKVSEAVTEAVCKTAKEVCAAVTDTVSQNAQKMSDTVSASLSNSAKEMSESLTCAIKKQFDDAQDTHDENVEALGVIEEKLGQKLITYQIKMIKNLDNVGSAVTTAAAKIAASQETMIQGIISMADGLTKMSKGMDQLLDSTEKIKNNHISCVDMLVKADEAIKKLVQNLEYLSDAQEKLNKEHVARALINREY